MKTTKLTSNKIAETKYVDKVNSKTKSISFSFGVNTKVHGIKLTNNFSYSTSITKSGPSNEKIVGTNIKASHAYFTSAIWGYVNEYTFDVYSNGSGKKIKTVKTRAFVRTNTQGYAQNGYTKKNGQVMVENAPGIKYKTFSSHYAFTKGLGRGKTSHVWW
ncbi:hypothetical protein [Paraliobacillus sp. JSM ZJ581]|uniref:hypothetical protein n=1 Tax=Paraliobacillus sp. JSM ZJ581 TaxID=3342118 RepID=UPI0035A87046